MNKIEEFKNPKILQRLFWNKYKQQVGATLATAIIAEINSAVLEKDIKIDILEQEVDSWKNVFSKELVEEQKEKDAKIAKSKKYKEVETFYQNGINSVIEKIAKEILEQ